MIGAGGQDEAFLIEDVVNHKKDGDTIYYQIKWVGYPTDDNTWEPLDNIRKPASGLISNYLDKLKLDKTVWFPDIKRKRKRNVRWD